MGYDGTGRLADKVWLEDRRGGGGRDKQWTRRGRQREAGQERTGQRNERQAGGLRGDTDDWEAPRRTHGKLSEVLGAAGCSELTWLVSGAGTDWQMFLDGAES